VDCRESQIKAARLSSAALNAVRFRFCIPPGGRADRPGLARSV